MRHLSRALGSTRHQRSSSHPSTSQHSQSFLRLPPNTLQFQLVGAEPKCGNVTSMQARCELRPNGIRASPNDHNLKFPNEPNPANGHSAPVMRVLRNEPNAAPDATLLSSEN